MFSDLLPVLLWIPLLATAESPPSTPESPPSAPVPQSTETAATPSAAAAAPPASPDRSDAETDRSSPEALLAAYLRVWETRDISLYGELLHPGFLHLELGQEDSDEPWDRARELAYAERNLHSGSGDQRAQLISLETVESTLVPGGVEVRCVLDHVTTPAEGEPTELRVALSLHAMKDREGLWVIRVLEERELLERAPDAGS